MVFDQKELYPTLTSKASILLYLMIKNHPFQNGNKRIALVTLLLFLYRHKKWIRVKPTDLYQFTIQIAESDARKKDKMVELIDRFITMYLVDV
jgi:death-on-curing protein